MYQATQFICLSEFDWKPRCHINHVLGSSTVLLYKKVYTCICQRTYCTEHCHLLLSAAQYLFASRPLSTCLRALPSSPYVAEPISRHAIKAWNAFCLGLGNWILLPRMLSIVPAFTSRCIASDSQHSVTSPDKSFSSFTDGTSSSDMTILLLVFHSLVILKQHWTSNPIT